jgi:hypothetical protein
MPTKRSRDSGRGPSHPVEESPSRNGTAAFHAPREPVDLSYDAESGAGDDPCRRDRSRRPARAAKAILEAVWLEKGRGPEIPASVTAWDLGSGESSVIATALQLPGAYAVIDDLSGRKCSLALGIGVIGTLGVIVAAYRRGALTDPRAILLELRSAGMWRPTQSSRAPCASLELNRSRGTTGRLA